MVNKYKAISTGFFISLVILFLAGFSVSDESNSSYPEEFWKTDSTGLKVDLTANDRHDSEKTEPLNFWDEIPANPSTTMPEEILDDYWYGQFQRINQEVAGAKGTEIIFFGNSITWSWSLGPATGLPVWKSEYARFNPINMGNSGDITPVMLYRVTHGNLDFPEGKQPKVAVLLCGTNNFVVNKSAGGKVLWELGPDCPPADVAHGARAIAQVFRRRLPETRVILMGILPVSNQVKWMKCQETNAVNAAMKVNENEVVYLDLQDKFLQADGSINNRLYTDGTHLTPEGYRVWAKSLDAYVTSMMEAAPLDPEKIMLIGGSLTEGSQSSDSYRRYLDGMLRRQGYLIDFVGSRKKHFNNQTEPDSYQYDVDHEGNWGKNSDWFAENITYILNQNVPDIAVIQIGAEDILAGSGTNESMTNEILDNIDKVVKSIRRNNRDAKIVLANILPIQGETEKVSLLNQKISRYAERHSKRKSPVVLADLHEEFIPVEHYADEGDLPNAAGAKRIASVLAEAISSLIK